MQNNLTHQTGTGTAKTLPEPESEAPVQCSALLAAAVPFIRIVADAAELPPHMNGDDCPLARHIPGAWPTLGELRKLVAEIQKAANAESSDR